MAANGHLKKIFENFLCLKDVLHLPIYCTSLCYVTRWHVLNFARKRYVLNGIH